MVRLIKTHHLVLNGNTKHTSILHGKEQDARRPAAPGGNANQASHLVAKLSATTSVEGAPAFTTQVILSSKQAHGKHTPHAAEEVYWRGIQGVIDAQLLQKHGRIIVHRSANESDDNGGIGLNHCAASSDADKTSQDAVQGRAYIGLILVQHVDDGGTHATGCSRQGGGHSHARRQIHALVREGRHRVESIPAKPKDEGSERG
mmetsp:Transcript_28274/g.72708  ORF Transcript_28274/g.72708 Transcript_28274/m.72708 type:complete len:203 (-) Transcript_28274:1013-1621(-)